jgi:hypothetical protein
MFARRACRHHRAGARAQGDGDVRHLARRLALRKDDFTETGALVAKMVEVREIETVVAHATAEVRGRFVYRNGAIAHRLEQPRKRGAFVIGHGNARFSGGAKRPP